MPTKRTKDNQGASETGEKKAAKKTVTGRPRTEPVPRVSCLFEMAPLTVARLRFVAECDKQPRRIIVEEALNALFERRQVVLTEEQAERLYGKPSLVRTTYRRRHPEPLNELPPQQQP